MSLCLLPRISKETLRNFLYRLTVAVARSSDDSIQYMFLLSVWMTLCLSIIVRTKATPVGRILEATHRGPGPRAKSDTYECIVGCVELQCVSGPCLNGGTCHEEDFTMDRFQCSCTAQFTGPLCELGAYTTSRLPAQVF